ncbi:MAG: helix-hairpin-helix domain-containing protein [Acidobacteriota bacterium]
MKNWTVLALSVPTTIFLASFILTAAPAAQSETAPPAGTAADPAVGLYERTCGECHDSVRIVSKRRTKDEWQDVINKMIEEGATASGKEFETIFAFLLRNYGKVYLNSAPPDQIATILTLPRKDADAIVAYRTANGAFADLDAIKKVPGIDVKVIEDHKDAIAF